MAGARRRPFVGVLLLTAASASWSPPTHSRTWVPKKKAEVLVGDVASRVAAAVIAEPTLASTPHPTPPPTGATSRRRRRSVPVSGVPKLVLDDYDAKLPTSSLVTSSSNKTISEHSYGKVAVHRTGAKRRAIFDFISGLMPGDAQEQAIREGPFSRVAAFPGGATQQQHHQAKSDLAFFKPGRSSLITESSLLLELHLYGATIEQLHASTKYSVVDFLLLLQGELAKAELKRYQFKIFGVHGRFKAGDGPEGPLTGPHADEEVLVRFKVSSIEAGEEAKTWLIKELNKRLKSSKVLHESDFAPVLKNATITEGHRPVGFGPAAVQQKEEERTPLAVLIPIVISAGFTGVMVWLAAI